MDWIGSNENGLGFSGLVHQIYSYGPAEPVFMHTPTYLGLG